MRKKWNIKKYINDSIGGIDNKIIEQLLLQKNITSKEDAINFFSPSYNELHDAFLFDDMDKVVKRVKKAIRGQEIIGIFGDHDADGVSSATVLVEGLEKLGLNVDVYIPDKITEEHGINTKAIDEFVATGVTLMFSVDCGTSNVEEVDYANEQGLDVIITDHHHAPAILPNAYAIINPQLPKCKYPFKDLSGTAVTFKVVEALFGRLAPEKSAQLKWLLDVVCVGTIADCMPLVGENRILVKYGLIVLSKTQRLGYKEMCNVGKIAINNGNIPSATTVAFQIAPRINAAGRMSHAKHAFELMRETDKVLAIEQAKELEKQNIKRREITEILTDEVEQIIEKEHKEKSFIVLSGENYPVGIVGIIAGRIAEKYGKPTGIFTKFENESRGSFRSVDGVHILDALNACSDHLGRFGGHEQAAGATIANEQFEDFAQSVNEYMDENIDLSKNEKCINANCEITFGDINRELSTELQKFEPFGEGNEEPVFVLRNLIVDDIRTVGSDKKHLKLKLSQEGFLQSYDAIGFGIGYLINELQRGDIVDVIVNIQENEWMGNISIQFNIVDIVKK